MCDHEEGNPKVYTESYEYETVYESSSSSCGVRKGRGKLTAKVWGVDLDWRKRYIIQVKDCVDVHTPPLFFVEQLLADEATLAQAIRKAQSYFDGAMNKNRWPHDDYKLHPKYKEGGSDMDAEEIPF